MIKTWTVTAILILGLTVSSSLVQPLHINRNKHQTEAISRFSHLPSGLLQTMSLEFHGVIADYLFLKIMTYMGINIKKNQKLEQEKWLLLHQVLNKITDLDKRFWDPYLFAEVMLVWQAGMLDEAEQLLIKATESRPEDYRPYYFLAFNQFYFNKNSDKAAPFLRKAAQRPGAPDYLKGLAARYSLLSNQTAIGITFLEEELKETSEPTIKEYLQTRLTTLKIIYFLEQKVQEYAKTYDHLPASLTDLVTARVIPDIPNDPYGGVFILQDNGRVYTTSKLIQQPKYGPGF